MGCAVAESLPSRPPGKGEAPVLLEEGGLDCAPNADAVPALKRGIGAGGSALDVPEVCICMKDNIASDSITNRRLFQKGSNLSYGPCSRSVLHAIWDTYIARGNKFWMVQQTTGRHLSSLLSGALCALPAAHDWGTKDGLQCSDLSCLHLQYRNMPEPQLRLMEPQSLGIGSSCTCMDSKLMVCPKKKPA